MTVLHSQEGGICDILIPAFCRPDLLRTLLRSLADHTNRSLLSRIWIGDDESDTFSRERFLELARESGLPVTIVRHQKNLGFGANCNHLFSLGKSPYCVVLNTDTVVPPFWLERMLQPFHDQKDVALATPFSTNAANLTLRLAPGQHWREVDGLLASRTPLFPDACTAIGFCLAIDRKKVETMGEPLFDAAFGRGYGEDTDLHYRVLQRGYRSVVVDHLLVHHVGGESFASLPETSKLREKGMTLFRKKWGVLHDRALMRYDEVRSSIIDPVTGYCSLLSHQRHLDVLVVFPSTNRRYGGVWALCSVIEFLLSCGFHVQAVVNDQLRTESDTASFGFEPFRDTAECVASFQTVGCVLASSHDTLSFSRDLAERFGCPLALFLQGMETAFPTGANDDTLQHYKRISHTLAVSECLEQYFRFIAPHADITRLPFGPDSDLFYSRDIKRIPKSVAIAINKDLEKGSVHALQLGLFLRERGFTLTFFGWDPEAIDIPSHVGDVMHDTSRDAVATLFSRTEFFIDCSRMEGLGLLPLEAAFCGCIPVLDVRGGPEYIFTDRHNCIMVPGYKQLPQVIEDVTALTVDQRHALRENAQELRKKYSLQSGVEAARNALLTLSEKKDETSSNLEAYALASL